MRKVFVNKQVLTQANRYRKDNYDYIFTKFQSLYRFLDKASPSISLSTQEGNLIKYM